MQLIDFVAAVEAFDTDGRGFVKLEEAANNTLLNLKDNGCKNISLCDYPENSNFLVRGQCSYCLLAHAWKNNNIIEVSDDCFIRGDHLYYHKNKKVISWFDNLSSDLSAARTVLKYIRKAREQELIT